MMMVKASSVNAAGKKSKNRDGRGIQDGQKYINAYFSFFFVFLNKEIIYMWGMTYRHLMFGSLCCLDF